MCHFPPRTALSMGLKWHYLSSHHEESVSPQFNNPVNYKEDKEWEEHHVAQEFCLASSGEGFQSAHCSTKETSRRVKFIVLEEDHMQNYGKRQMHLSCQIIVDTWS